MPFKHSSGEGFFMGFQQSDTISFMLKRKTYLFQVMRNSNRGQWGKY